MNPYISAPKNLLYFSLFFLAFPSGSSTALLFCRHVLFRVIHVHTEQRPPTSLSSIMHLPPISGPQPDR